MSERVITNKMVVSRALLGVLLLVGSAACEPAMVGAKIPIPSDAGQTCMRHCESIGMRLSAVAIMANNVGCVCEPPSETPAPKTQIEGTSSAGGMATVLMQPRASQQAAVGVVPMPIPQR